MSKILKIFNILFRWEVTMVSECSNYCGPGNRNISTRCIQIMKNTQKETTEPIATRACKHILRPAKQEPCMGPCDTAHWSYGEWNSCSVTCGDGIQSRTETCHDSLDMIIEYHKCDTNDKQIIRACTEPQCPMWSYGMWSSVNAF